MSLDKMKRVARVWNWLPTFRAAGETERLASAGKDLGISTSAVSRAVRLIEQDLGHSLFDRGARRVQLNESGRELLNAVRSAMRVIDEAISELDQARFCGQVSIACDEPFASLFVMPALAEIARVQPNLIPHVLRVSSSEAGAALRKGDIDVVLGGHAISAPGVETRFLRSIPLGYYIGPHHPYYGRRNINPPELADFTVAAPARAGRDGVGSPLGSVGLIVDDPSLLVAAALETAHVVLLPDAIAVRHPALRGIGSKGRAALEAYVSSRDRLGTKTRADVVVDAIVALDK